MDGRDESRIKPARHADQPRCILPSMLIRRELTIPQHESNDCPERQTPPEGYVCRRCNQGGHYIRDCPTKYEKGDTGGKKPPPGYVCRGCASELHLIDDCPVVQQNRQEREERRRRDGPPKDIGRTYQILSMNVELIRLSQRVNAGFVSRTPNWRTSTLYFARRTSFLPFV